MHRAACQLAVPLDEVAGREVNAVASIEEEDVDAASAVPAVVITECTDSEFWGTVAVKIGDLCHGGAKVVPVVEAVCPSTKWVSRPPCLGLRLAAGGELSRHFHLAVRLEEQHPHGTTSVEIGVIVHPGTDGEVHDAVGVEVAHVCDRISKPIFAVQ